MTHARWSVTTNLWNLNGYECGCPGWDLQVATSFLLSDGCGWAFLDRKGLDALFALLLLLFPSKLLQGTVCVLQNSSHLNTKPSMYTTRDMKQQRRPLTIQGALPFGDKRKSCRSRIVQKIPSPHTRFVVWWCSCCRFTHLCDFAPHTHRPLVRRPVPASLFIQLPHHPLQGA